MDRWTFLTNHGHVLLCIAADPESRMKDVAEKVGITERATQRIVADLVSEGYLSSQKKGRRNLYQVNSALRLRHPVERHNEIGQLLLLLDRSIPRSSRPAARAESRP
jgi:predicted transcriptional regulator